MTDVGASRVHEHTALRSTEQLRIGVTGHRQFLGIQQISAEVAIAVGQLVGADAQVTVVSALAEGADRIVVDEVLRHQDAKLEAILPLAAQDYRTDFADDASRAEFDRYIDIAYAVTVISGAPDSREAAYETAGRAMVDSVDVVVALWDGKPAVGRGGTAEIVDYARATGVRVVVVAVQR